MKQGKRLFTYFVPLGFFLFCAVTVATAQTPQQIAQKAFRSTVLLVMEDANGEPLSLGSGFFVGDGQIATNLHVVEGAARGYAKLVGKEAKFNIEGYTAIDAQRDLIILKVPTFGPEIILLGNSDLVEVGENVYVVGNPRGLEGTFSDGIVSSIRLLDGDKLIQITAPVSPGSSGGPVLNRRGEVIGISVLSVRDGQNLNFAIPSNHLKNLLAKAGVAKPLFQALPLIEASTITTQPITTQPDGRTMLLIPAGEFQMGSNDPDSDADEQPIQTIHVDAFYMDMLEVTNLDFKKFVLANPQWQKSRVPEALHNGNYLKLWDGNNYPFGKANHPVVYVSWYAAIAYAEWAGKRLPTETEWEKAARGGLVSMRYPWGNTIDSMRANYANSVNNMGGTRSVISYGANGYGLYAIAGNVREWCLDESVHRNPLHGLNTMVNLDLVTKSCASAKSTRVVRGGSWIDSARFVRVANRFQSTPTEASGHLGFRCVRAVAP